MSHAAKLFLLSALLLFLPPLSAHAALWDFQIKSVNSQRTDDGRYILKIHVLNTAQEEQTVRLLISNGETTETLVFRVAAMDNRVIETKPLVLEEGTHTVNVWVQTRTLIVKAAGPTYQLPLIEAIPQRDVNWGLVLLAALMATVGVAWWLDRQPREFYDVPLSWRQAYEWELERTKGVNDGQCRTGPQ